MECPKCQHENPEQAKFCLECGAKLERSCPSCGESLPATARFCMSCGHDLSKPLAPSAHPESHQIPASEGERRQATIVFCDLAGYTAMNEKLDPEEVEGIMGRIKAEAVSIVESHGGIVNQFVGDEVLALFGIPSAHEDDPRQAVKAALELHELTRRFSPEVEQRIGRPLRMHTGIHTGLIVTNLRDARDGTYGITGDTVNTGARLKALAEDDQVLVSQETQRRISPFFETEVLPAVEMKGKAGAVRPYRVLGESRIETRFDAAEQRGFTPFTGRERELAILNACLEKALAGEGQFVTVVGEAGVGKSRLLYEFRHSLEREKVTVLQGRCQAFGENTPYLPLIDALRRGLQLRDEDSPEAMVENAVANVKAIDPALEPYIPAYLHLLSISSKQYALPQGLAGDELRRTLQEGYAAILIQTAKLRPLVFFLEDWHWADEASDAALKYLLGLIAPYPLLLIVIYRPQYTANWGSVGGIRGYSLGSYTCNIGDQNLMWGNTWGGTPGLAMNAYRLYDGRLMQVGLSWVKHACCAAAGTGCGMGCNGQGGSWLGVGCRDIYSAGYNGGQTRLGPRSDLNPYTGAWQPAPGGSGNAIFRRLQIAESDITEGNFPDSLYFVEGVYIGTDDAQWGNWLNNASYRQVTLGGGFELVVTGVMYETVPASLAWHDHGNGINVPDESVQIVNVDVPDEGRFVAAAKARDNGDGTWRYEYAVFNLNSHRSGGSLSIPVPVGAVVTNVGFHDVDYHSGAHVVVPA
ncbi:MAG: AAA family ATPase [SAR324 cluster bacterium]|nr:AAA family ATPase [SAR324 cluster bacterium]